MSSGGFPGLPGRRLVEHDLRRRLGLGRHLHRRHRRGRRDRRDRGHADPGPRRPRATAVVVEPASAPDLVGPHRRRRPLRRRARPRRRPRRPRPPPRARRRRPGATRSRSRPRRRSPSRRPAPRPRRATAAASCSSSAEPPRPARPAGRGSLSPWTASSARSWRVRSPADVVLDEPDLVAFLDRRPVFKGHVLLVPRRHVDTLLDLPAGAARHAARGGPAPRRGRRRGARRAGHVRRGEQRREPVRAAPARPRRAAHQGRRAARLLLAAHDVRVGRRSPPSTPPGSPPCWHRPGTPEPSPRHTP